MKVHTTIHTIPSFFLKLYIKEWMKVQLTQKEWEKFWIISTERGTKFPKRATKLCHTRNRCPKLAICVHYGRFYELLSRNNEVYGICLFVCLFLGLMPRFQTKIFCLLNQQNSTQIMLSKYKFLTQKWLDLRSLM